MQDYLLWLIRADDSFREFFEKVLKLFCITEMLPHIFLAYSKGMQGYLFQLQPQDAPDRMQAQKFHLLFCNTVQLLNIFPAPRKRFLFRLAPCRLQDGIRRDSFPIS